MDNGASVISTLGGLGGMVMGGYGGNGGMSMGNPHENVVEVIIVPDNSVGLVIGKGGSEITQIQAQSGARVQMAPESTGDGTRQCTLQGTKMAVERAKQLIHDVITRANARRAGGGSLDNGSGGINIQLGPNAITYDMLIPGTKCGLIIGKAGETIRQLQEQSGVKMMMIQDNTEAGGAPKPLRMNGDPERIEIAKKLVQDLLNSRNDEGGVIGGGGGMGGGPRGGPRGAPNQGTNVQGGAVPVTMPGGAMYMPQTAYQQVQMQQQTYMQQPNPYYQYAGGQPTMIQGAYPIPMTMQQQGMMGQPQRYVPQATHPGMMMQYNVQQQYGGGPPGVNPQQGGGLPMGSGGGQQGGGGGNGATSSSSTTNGGPASNVGVGQGGPPNAHPPSQPPTPGAVPPSSQTGGGGPPQSGMMTSQGGPPGMAPPPVPSPSMYGIPYPQGVMYYNQAGGGMEMHGGGGGEGAEGMHPMQHPYQYNPGQYFQSAPPHLRATYPNMSHGMQQQQQQHAPAQPSQSQN